MQLPYPVRTLGQNLLGGIPVRVRSGINQGRRWSLASAGRGYAAGRFARERLALLQEWVRPGETFWDLGAHKGFMTLAAARMVGDSGHVVAVEPGAANLRFLRRHLRWNGVGNVTVVPKAVGAHEERVLFGGSGDSLAYQVGRGQDEVEMTTLAHLVEREGLPRPTAVKMDIEGQEAAALRGAGDLLGPELLLMISVHSRALFEECRQVLEGRGFRILPLAEMERRLGNPGEDWGGDHDMLALGNGR